VGYVATTLAALAAWALAASVAAPAASAAGGTWGAGSYRFADGIVCRSGATTSPLAAWTVTGGHRAYLTRSVVSNGRLDSAAPPVPSAGTPLPPTPVSPGPEFAVAGDIAAVAYLVSHGGDAAANVAAAVLSQTDPNPAPSCADTGTAAALLAQARRLAGPYQVRVAGPSTPVRPGARVTVTATVRTSAGEPVPGAQVSFGAGGASVSQDSVTTDANGVASDEVVPTTTSASSVDVTATTAVPVGLYEATISATPSFTNPTGASVPAVYAAPPSRFSGSTTLVLDQAAHPVVRTTLPSQLFSVDAPFVPSADVSGLNGHSADVDFDLRGPLPLHDRTLCAGIAPSSWNASAVHVASTSSVPTTGDGAVRGGALTPTRTGCYAVKVTVATTDATPAVVRTAPLTVVGVLDTAIRPGDQQPAIATPNSAKTFGGTLAVSHTHGLTGGVLTTLLGPIRPQDGDCTADAPGWAKAPRHSVPARVRPEQGRGSAVTHAGTYRYTVAAPTAEGCYRLRPQLSLTGPNGARLLVAPDSDRPAYVLHPTVSATVARTWAVSPEAVPVQVEVDGLYGLAAQVHVSMYVAPAVPAGCAHASFAAATPAGNGPDVAVPARPGIVSVAAQSGPTPHQGCYAVVPEVVLAADPHVRIAGDVGAPGSTLIAGVDPNKHIGSGASHGDSGTPLEFVLAMCALGAILAIVVIRVAFAAWRSRDEPSDATWQPLRPARPDGLPFST
jgi:hypothetical protein